MPKIYIPGKRPPQGSTEAHGATAHKLVLTREVVQWEKQLGAHLGEA